MSPAKRVAVIGVGPAGAITIDALAQEKCFDIIRVFERREGPGGCWIGDSKPPSELGDFTSLSSRSADGPFTLPEKLPAQTPKSLAPRFTESSVYPYLETNVDLLPMQFSQEPIIEKASELSISLHGRETPFRHWSVMKRYIESLINRRGYKDLVSYNTTVERAEKVGSEWRLTLRKAGNETDYWWVERFDAVVVASGHYSVPYIPHIDGLENFAWRKPGNVIHSKQFRGRDAFRGKRVVVVGASVSAADIAFDLVHTAESPVHAVMVGHRPNGYFGDEAFNHPGITKHQSVSQIDGNTVFFKDGSSLPNVDHIIFGTGYTWTLPFLPNVEIRNNRIPELYQHVVYQKDPSLLFVGAVSAGLTFKVFEWQAVLAARIVSGRTTLPSIEEQRRWEADRITARGDGPKFTLIHPEFEEYFETLRRLAGPGDPGAGRQLPPYQPVWFERFMRGHEKRKAMWRRISASAAQIVIGTADEKANPAKVGNHVLKARL